MAKAQVGAAGIEFIQGALKRPKKKDGHNHGNYLVMTHRTAETTNPNCQRIYTFGADRYDRKTPVTANETWARQRFAAIAAAVTARKADLMKVNQDRAAFLAQKENGIKTMKAYLWSLETAAYDADHPRS